MIEICLYPGCNKQIPKYRKKQGFHTCCKLCSNAWVHIPVKIRKEIKAKHGINE